MQIKQILAYILIICLFSFLVSLGFWQLSRADEKSQIVKQIQIANEQKPIQINKNNYLLLNKKEHFWARLTGVYDTKHQLIYDNQINNGIAGYYVLTPFLIKNTNLTILINRGFITWDKNRNKFADISIDNKERNILIQIKKVQKRFELKNIKLKDTYPLLIQSIDISILSNKTQHNLSPMIGLLSPAAKSGFLREWQPFYGSVDKHISYAIQWFLMAFVLLIISFVLIKQLKKRP